MTFEPTATMDDLDRGRKRLDQAADIYHDAVEKYEDLEQAFELEMAKARVAADNASEKLPSQDRRRDLALIHVHREHPELYANYHAAKAHKEAVAVKYRALAASVNAAQTLLRGASA
jgi:exonuclease VII small subunit